MAITIDLTPDQTERLSDLAQQQGISTEELARQALLDLLDRRLTIDSATQYILHKNSQLYRRLAR
ncbi:MAG: ribbon-helix-helix protein, CopG family [Bacteroidales bacterium]|nr:ribbon-helix-helix protein, CopG family [Bacteroidales bacterium]